MIQHFETIGQERECKLLVLDSYTANHPSHRLYHRLGFEIWGFHFVKTTADWAGHGTP
jgi:RimJ/RimL family protein N-acetyltransferase